MTKIVVFGSINADFVVDVMTLPSSGETIMGSNLRILSGGKGGNQAYAAAKLTPADVTVSMIARVGDDGVGEKLRSDLAEAGANVSLIKTMDQTPSGTAFITVDEHGANTIVVSAGANGTWTPESVAELPLCAGDLLVLQLEVPVAAIRALVLRAGTVGARVVLNAAPADPAIIDLLPKVDLLVVNEIEAQQLFGLTERSFELVQVARAMTGGDLVITRGGDGVTVAERAGQVKDLPAHRINVIDTVGAGDAFVGGLAVALARGSDIFSAARYGNAVGALTTTVVGARHPELSKIAVDALFIS